MLGWIRGKNDRPPAVPVDSYLQGFYDRSKESAVHAGRRPTLRLPYPDPVRVTRGRGISGWRLPAGPCGMAGDGPAWRDHVSVLRPLAIAVLAFMAVCVASKILSRHPVERDRQSIARVSRGADLLGHRPRGAESGTAVAGHYLGAIPGPAHHRVPVLLAGRLPPVGVGTAHRIRQHGRGALALVGFARPGDRRRAHAAAWFNVLCAVSILMMNGTRGAARWRCCVTLFPLLLVRYQRFTARMFVVAIAYGSGRAVVAVPYLMPHSLVASVWTRPFVGNPQVRAGQRRVLCRRARLKMWEIGLAYFQDHPWSGYRQ